MISKKCLLILSYLIGNSFLFIHGCKTSSNDNEAVWKPDVYVGSPAEKAIVRSGDDMKKRLISCDDENFSMYVCMHKNDVEHMFKVCLESKDK